MPTLTVTVTDGTNPVSGTQVQVWSGMSTLVAMGNTGGLGTYSSTLSAGVYTVTVPKKRWSFPDTTVTITNSPVTVTVVGTNLAIQDPVTPRVVRLFGFAVNPDGHPAQGNRVVVRTQGYGQQRAWVPGASTSSGVDPQNVAIMALTKELLTDDKGYWETDVIPESIVGVDIPELRFRKVFRVPDDTRVTTLNIRDARPDPSSGPEAGINSDSGSYARDYTLG